VAVTPNRLFRDWRSHHLVGIEELEVERQAGGMVGHLTDGRLFRTGDAKPDPGIAKIVVDRAVKIEQAALSAVPSGPSR
jgi:flagellar motor protein MotB